MKLAYYIKKNRLKCDPSVEDLLARLRADGHDCCPVEDAAGLAPDTHMLLSLGGDGTFLAAARIAVHAGVPVLGVNMGRLGFLSEYRPDDVVERLRSGEFSIETREMLSVMTEGAGEGPLPLALNEVTVSRCGAAMLGVDVSVNGEKLPTYWADGLLVATSSGSTAYSLSVGGPICTPDSDVLIIAPISPHNLNLRPLIVPKSAEIVISLHSRTGQAVFTIDNLNYLVPADARLTVRAADTSLKRVCLGRSNFINALRTRLLWGEDVRNSNEHIF